jgi:hypothetical protein
MSRQDSGSGSVHRICPIKGVRYRLIRARRCFHGQSSECVIHKLCWYHTCRHTATAVTCLFVRAVVRWEIINERTLSKAFPARRLGLPPCGLRSYGRRTDQARPWQYGGCRCYRFSAPCGLRLLFAVFVIGYLAAVSRYLWAKPAQHEAMERLITVSANAVVAILTLTTATPPVPARPAENSCRAICAAADQALATSGGCGQHHGNSCAGRAPRAPGSRHAGHPRLCESRQHMALAYTHSPRRPLRPASAGDHLPRAMSGRACGRSGR